MSGNSTPQNITFPQTEWKVQSPYLYLQSAGSTGADGSTYGAHVRWMLLRNLGRTHLPKGDHAATTINFNRQDDFVQLFRSRYTTRYPTIIDFSVPPDYVDDDWGYWLYMSTNTDTVVYIVFKDMTEYGVVRGYYDPATHPLQFIADYSPALIEVDVKDKLFFAAEFDIARSATTVLRAEALSVGETDPLAERFVTCRRKFTDANWCDVVRDESYSDDDDEPVSCCDGDSLLPDGGFENSTSTLSYQTDYQFKGASQPGVLWVTPDASAVDPAWTGFPRSGTVFLAVNGSTEPDKAVLRFELDVDPETDYCFGGSLCNLYRADRGVEIHIRISSPEGLTDSFYRHAPRTTGVWEDFTFLWNSGNRSTVIVEIFSRSRQDNGNDFGIDDLWFCKSRAVSGSCAARIVSENIRALRFKVQNGFPKRIAIETYDDYIAGALWEGLGQLALTDNDSTAFARLEPAPGTVGGAWRKFNDTAFVNAANYRDRWERDGGLRYGVRRYIDLSNTDPAATDTLQGEVQPRDGAVETSVLEMLRMVSLDFHVARMLGLGYLDRDIAADTDEYIYLGMYDTEGELDDIYLARPVRHYFMGVPTAPLDHRLPDKPQLKPVSYGLAVDNGEPEPEYLTDAGGYTPDGLSRYINLFVQPEAVDESTPGEFFVPSQQFSGINRTSSIFYGMEYRKQGEAGWRKPEIAHDEFYKDLDTPQQFETLPLPNNPDQTRPIITHAERENGVHEYAAYGINWFSRASSPGNIVATNSTLIKKANRLLPPSNLAVQLIQTESPLMLTTKAEQDMLEGISEDDKTLLRVTFNYFHTHDINYDFADKVQLLFRPEMPRNVVGAIKSVTDDPADSRRAILRTTDYISNSNGKIISPVLPVSLYGNFVGGVISCQQKNYVVTHVAPPGGAGEGPVFTVRKLMQGNASDPDADGTFITVREYKGPDVGPDSTTQVMFMAVENMADIASWGTPNPLSKVVSIGDATWTTQTETYIQDGDTVTTELRGIWDSAVVWHTPDLDELEENEKAPGLYRIDFKNYKLPHHPQSNDPDPVEWYKGVVRIERAGAPGGLKKVLEVIWVEHLGTDDLLVLYAIDNSYDPADPVVTGTPVTVNYYPGYKVYLHADPLKGFTSGAILPAEGEGNRKTWLGARSCDTSHSYYSAVGAPAPVIALEFIEPAPPEIPTGFSYATRPDFYYKSSYTFRMDFKHKPFAVAMYRANEEAILRAIYSEGTYQAVRAELAVRSKSDGFYADRWKNLLSFNYIYDINDKENYPYYDPTGSNDNGEFRMFPQENGYRFPKPDKNPAWNGSPGSILEDLKEAIHGAFTPLTEMPLMYAHIKGPSYAPVPKPQKIRDEKGALLDPADPEFDIAPMAKRTGNGFQIQFIDFTLDGSGNNIFFYIGREIGNRGRLGVPGPVAGPVRLINTRPPDAPAIRKVYTQEGSVLENTRPAVRFEVNSYPAVQKVERMALYRATDARAALTVRTMQPVKTVDFVAGEDAAASITLMDDFSEGMIPYGDPLYYRIVALRRIENPDGSADWAPSHPSKLLLTAVIDSINPEAPPISYTSDGLSGDPAMLTGVVLSWPVTVYNGTYYLEKMNSAGNWVTIYKLKTNDDISVKLLATALATDTLPKKHPGEGWPIYNRFRVRVENSSGLFNLEDKVLTI